jgi:fatty-acyl-CoA synthase
MPQWNVADCLDRIAVLRGDEDCLIQGERCLSWQQVERRARNVGAWMRGRGASHHGRVAIYTYNHPAYMEGVWAAFKTALVPLNVNYRYREEEVRYLLDNADAEIVVVHEDFLPVLRPVLPQVATVKGVLVVTEKPGTPLPAGMTSYEEAAETDHPAPDVARSGDDMLFLYTGGTTGMPKGVMWRQDDLYYRFAGGGLFPPPTDMAGLEAMVMAPPIRLRTLIGPPLMHGTGWFTAMIAWMAGGAVIMLDDPKKFDAAQLWDTVERVRATTITIVGDSFARPMLRALEAGCRARDLSSIMVVASSGVMWSQETKQGLLKHVPQAMLVDAFSSSEAIGMGMSITTSAGAVQTANFQLSDKTRLFDEDLRLLEVKPGVKGLVGVGGAQPIGYHKDPAKSARTFVETEAGRFSVPGDWAVVNDDGVTLTLLGRGSVCINTGGEKVFPEEVEEAIKRHPDVQDVVVVGVPDERFGEAVTAVVSTNGVAVDPEALKQLVKDQLAGFKAPKHIVFVEEVYRSPSGKADFKRTKQVAAEALGL